MTVSVLIPNRNSFEAVQLCIESVRHYTRHPHKIVVLDDTSQNDVDLAYLRDCQRKGWLELIENTGPALTHGGALNVLLNEVCDTRYAFVLDCDVQILGPLWLAEMMALIEGHADILGMCDFRHKMINQECYIAGFYKMWFGLLNMHAYRDGMQVDWRYAQTTLEAEPFKSMFMCLDGVVKPKGFNYNLVKMDPGSKLWVKVRYDNPRGYRVLHVPRAIAARYRHFGHISMISIPDPSHSDQVRINRETRFTKIREELRKLRCQN